MNEPAILEAIYENLQRIAPEIEPSELAADQPLRDQVDLDSMDWLNFLVGLHEALKVDIPEADYKKLGTVNDLVAYLGGALQARG
jgi:acyl carrier protein